MKNLTSLQRKNAKNIVEKKYGFGQEVIYLCQLEDKEFIQFFEIITGLKIKKLI